MSVDVRTPSFASPSPGLLAQLACLLEVNAPKPGNVHRGAGSDFEDCGFLDFCVSAAAIAGPLDLARTEGIGRSIRKAIEATRRVVATNTNLGMVLLLAPLAAVPLDQPLEAGVAGVLAATTIEDAREVYQAIRLAHPGGLGEVAEQDVAAEPGVSLLGTMRLAAGRDLVARQYANNYEQVLAEALPALRNALEVGQPLEMSIVSAYLTLLARHPDTLIARKRGHAIASEATRQAADVLASGWPDSEAGHARCRDLDDWLRADGHARNPGATADLIAAALFAGLRDGTIPLPLSFRR